MLKSRLHVVLWILMNVCTLIVYGDLGDQDNSTANNVVFNHWKL